jgi:hypothetical protein
MVRNGSLAANGMAWRGMRKAKKSKAKMAASQRIEKRKASKISKSGVMKWRKMQSADGEMKWRGVSIGVIRRRKWLKKHRSNVEENIVAVSIINRHQRKNESVSAVVAENETVIGGGNRSGEES